MENRNGLIVQAELTHADGQGERQAALKMIHRHAPGSTRQLTLGADKGYDSADFVAHPFTQRRACRLAGISSSSLACQPRPDRHARLRERLITLSDKHRRYGCRMLHARLVREGFKGNVKVVERIPGQSGRR